MDTPQQPSRPEKPRQNAEDLLGELVPPPARRRSLAVRLLAGAAGLGLLAFGVAGVILPLIPGWPFIVLSLPLLGMCGEGMRRWVNRLDKRMPLWLRLALRRRRKGKGPPPQAP